MSLHPHRGQDRSRDSIRSSSAAGCLEASGIELFKSAGSQRHARRGELPARVAPPRSAADEDQRRQAAGAHSGRRAREDARHGRRGCMTPSCDRALDRAGTVVASAAGSSATSPGSPRPRSCAASGHSGADDAPRAGGQRHRRQGRRQPRRRQEPDRRLPSAAAVSCDPESCSSRCRAREFRAGLYEVIKYGVIASPAAVRAASRRTWTRSSRASRDAAHPCHCGLLPNQG